MDLLRSNILPYHYHYKCCLSLIIIVNLQQSIYCPVPGPWITGGQRGEGGIGTMEASLWTLCTISRRTLHWRDHFFLQFMPCRVIAWIHWYANTSYKNRCSGRVVGGRVQSGLVPSDIVQIIGEERGGIDWDAAGAEGLVIILIHWKWHRVAVSIFVGYLNISIQKIQKYSVHCSGSVSSDILQITGTERV